MPSIRYNKQLNSVGVDPKNNLAVDSVGNLIIPVAPIGITVYSEGNHSDCRCAIVRIESSAGEQTFIPCRNSLPFKQNSELWLATSSDIHEVHVGSNFGNLTTQSAEFSINAGIIIDRPPGEFAATGVSVKISWGNQYIQSDDYYVCHQGMRTYFLGSISVDLNRLTLTYTPPSLPTDRSSVKCEQKEEPPEPEIIVIDAPYSWCDTVGSVRYTEDEVSGRSRYWINKETEVTVYPGEDREGKINEASICCVHPYGGNVEYVTLESLDADQTLSGDRYWRKTTDTRPLHVERAITV